MAQRRGSPVRTLTFAALAVLVVAAFLARRTGMVPGGERPFDPTDFRDAPRVTAVEALGLVGERAVVCGRVVNTVFARGTAGQPTFLNLERPYPDQPFDVVIWGRDRDRFDPPPEVFYSEARICVAGRVTAHRRVPRIEARTPEQIRFHRW
jgi:hypothetical protein